MKVGVLAITMAFLIAVCLPLGAMAGTAPDVDNDTVPDAADNCLTDPNGAANAPNNQCDTDGDGYGNTCDADTNQDNIVGIPDFGHDVRRDYWNSGLRYRRGGVRKFGGTVRSELRRDDTLSVGAVRIQPLAAMRGRLVRGCSELSS
jgi:hypothetical protein